MADLARLRQNMSSGYQSSISNHSTMPKMFTYKGISSRDINPKLHQTVPDIALANKINDMTNLSQLEEEYKLYRREMNIIKGEQYV